MQRHRLPAMTSLTGVPSVPTAPMLRAVERHHEARRAEAALRAVAVGHRALDRVERAAPRQALDGLQRLAVEHRQEEDAGIDRAPFDRVAVQLAEQHGAGAAIALGAAFLGAGAAQRVAQIVEDGGGGIGVLDLDHLAVEEEADHLGLPAAIQAPSRCRSAGVMRVGLPSGITCGIDRHRLDPRRRGADMLPAVQRHAARRRVAHCGRPRNGWPGSAAISA